MRSGTSSPGVRRITDLLFAGSLAALDIAPAVPGVGVRMVWPRGVRLTDRAQALVAFAADQARSTDHRHRNVRPSRRGAHSTPVP